MCAAELGRASVGVMQPTENGRPVHFSGGSSLAPSWDGRIPLEAQVRALIVVIGDVLAKAREELLLAEHDQVVGALSAQGADHALAVRVLLALPERDSHVLDAHGAQLLAKHLAVGAFSIAHQELGYR